MTESRLELAIIEKSVCDVVSVQLGIARDKVLPSSRLIEDFHIDSLDMIELIMELEDEFLVTIPDEPAHAVGKSVFTRHPFRLSDLAEIIYLQQGSGTPERKGWRRSKVVESDDSGIPFSQLSGVWQPDFAHKSPLFESIGSDDGIAQYRRRSDGMRCHLLPAGEFRIGNDKCDGQSDEQPVHNVRLDSFLMDAEPVSTTAFCRFLNSVEATEKHLADWFQLDPSDDRVDQLQITRSESGWRPVAGTETSPMVLVSWFGANAYSLWANGLEWVHYETSDGLLPSEAQWEYAAQGAFEEPSAEEPCESTLVYGQHQRGARYSAATMQMEPVHQPSGISAFGLHHMAGNIWHWCRDWFASDFYQQPESRKANPVNKTETGIRSERGGSWVGPIELCRTTYRRGRTPFARGRCLGFRCISLIEQLEN